MPMLAAIDNLIFLVLVAFAGLFKWLASRRQNPPDTNDPPEIQRPESRRSVRESTGSDEEQIRKFLEALGQPRGSNVPPPVSPRTNVPPRPVAPVSPPKSAIPIPPIRERPKPQQPRPASTVSTPPPVSMQPAKTWRPYEPAPVSTQQQAPTFEVHESSQISAPTMPQQTGAPPGVSIDQLTFAQLLQSPDGLRRAVILREIFGPPRSMQPLELTGV
jgi:hypothetical protein